MVSDNSVEQTLPFLQTKSYLKVCFTSPLPCQLRIGLSPFALVLLTKRQMVQQNYSYPPISPSFGSHQLIQPQPLQNVMADPRSLPHNGIQPYPPQYTYPPPQPEYHQPSSPQYTHEQPRPLPPMNTPDENYGVPQAMDTTGQVPPPGMRPRLTTSIFEEEGSLCFQVDVNGICVARREGTFPILSPPMLLCLATPLLLSNLQALKTNTNQITT